MSIPLSPTQSVTGEELFLIMAAYLLGCFTSGYYWVKWRAGVDIRHTGSRSVGARNAGRVLGRTAFVITLLFDLTKGMLAVSVAAHLGLRPEAIVAVMVAVVVGHSWPVQLGFRGGKGVATSLGALLAFDALIALVLIILFLPLWALIRSFTLAGLVAFALLPLAAFFCDLDNVEIAATSFLAILILITHRRNIREEFAGIFLDRQLKESAMHRHKGRGS
jgi:acyl phosphate:glycerol-3-phosphate acyltransferase